MNTITSKYSNFGKYRLKIVKILKMYVQFLNPYTAGLIYKYNRRTYIYDKAFIYELTLKNFIQQLPYMLNFLAIYHSSSVHRKFIYI